jgi:ParE toxin of type II toxin-antitoxin system, parDE
MGRNPGRNEEASVNTEVRFLPSSKQEILAAYMEYEQISSGLGERFSNAIQQLVDRIKFMPEGYGEVEPGVRAALVTRFPYVLYYEVMGSVIIVLSVSHGRRGKQTWISKD